MTRLRRTISQSDINLLARRGAAVTADLVSASDSDVARTLDRAKRGLLRRRSNLAAGSSPYVAKAVHFDGTQYLSTDSLACTNNGFLSLVYWLNCAADAVPGGRGIVFVSDPSGAYDTSHTIAYGDTGLDAGFGVGDAGDPTYYNIFWNNDGDSDNAPNIAKNAWTCVIASFQTNISGAINKIIKVFSSDTEVTLWATQENDSSNPSFDVGLNGFQFVIGSDSIGGNNLKGTDLADFRLMPGVSLLDGGGNIPLATRRLFIDADGKPCAPSIATAALGSPAILLSGDATTFATNQGTGGAFTVTGALTDASTSPSD